MPAEVFLIIAAINGGIIASDKIKDWMTQLGKASEGFKDASKLLNDIKFQILTCKAEAGIWMDFWGVEEDGAERYPTELWGRHGKTVEEILVSIQSIFESVLKDLEKFPKEKGFDKKSGASFVTCGAAAMLKELGRAQNQVGNLKRISQAAYEAKNSVTISGSCLTREQREKAQVSVFLDMAIEARLSFRGLFESCYAATLDSPIIKAIMLEMDLSRKNEGVALDDIAKMNDLTMHCHFLVFWGAEKVELFVEGPFPQGDEQLDASITPNTEFFNAVSDAAQERSLSFSINYSPDNRVFRSRAPLAAEKVPLLKPIADFLYDLNHIIPPGIGAEEFELPQCIHLAFKAAEYGLLLAGTTWMSSKFDSEALQRSVTSCNRHRYVLATDASNINFNESDRKELTTHIFKIGIFLAEIGTGKVIKTRPGSTSQTLELLLYEPRGQPERPTALVTLAQLEALLDDQGFGGKYAKAVLYCLADKREEYWNVIRTSEEEEKRNKAMKTALTEYYHRVYQELRELAVMDWERMEWSTPQSVVGSRYLDHL